MAIINTTPDSFYPGSRAQGMMALSRALSCIQDGADILDIGGESTRPGSAYVSEEEELDRVVPLIEKIRRESDIPVSIDTRKLPVAQAAIAAGANIVNDISALRDDPGMGQFVAETGVPLIMMHMQGTPENMQNNPHYHDVVADVRSFLKERLDYAQSQGIVCEKIILDPGIGFGKSHQHNLQLLKNLDIIVDMGFPVLMGHSRKSFIGRILGEQNNNGGEAENITHVSKRLFGSLAVVADSYNKGARIFRVHDVAETRDILDVLYAIHESGD